MEKATKVWLIVAASVVLVGCIIFAGVMAMFGWNFAKLSTIKYERNTYEISEAFDNISMNTGTAEIIFALSDDGKCKVECFEEEKAKHSVTVKEGALVIEVINNKHWYDYIGINFGSPKITVYLPKTGYTSLVINGTTGDIEIPKDFAFKDVAVSLSTGDVDFFASASSAIKIKGSTADIRVENITAGSLNLSVTTGKVTVSGVTCEGDVTVGVTTGKSYLTDIACKNIISSGSTGDISLNSVIATEKSMIKTGTGHVKFDGCDAAEISVETVTGDVKGSLLTDKVFITETSTGKIDVPKTTTGGICKIKTGTGDIKITVK